MSFPDAMLDKEVPKSSAKLAWELADAIRKLHPGIPVIVHLMPADGCYVELVGNVAMVVEVKGPKYYFWQKRFHQTRIVDTPAHNFTSVLTKIADTLKAAP